MSHLQKVATGPTLIGTIARWGTRGYGFITSDGLESEAWLHAKFLEDPDYEPRQGDRVEFEAERLPDGRFQARRVRSLEATNRAPRPVTSAPPSYAAYNDGRVAVKLSLPHFLLTAAVAPIAPPPTAPPPAPVEVAVTRAADSADDGARPPLAPVVEQEPAEERLAPRLDRRRGGRDGELGRLRADAARLDEELAQQQARRRELAEAIDRLESGTAGADAATVAGYLAAAVAGLERDFAQRRHLAEALDAARSLAIARSGLPTVLEYEELRKRLAELVAKSDVLGQKAFRALERERRMTLRDLADAGDRLDAAPSVRARFVAFLPAASGSGPASAMSVVVVAPLPGEVFAAGGEADPPGALGDMATQLACAFWQAAERAVRESHGGEPTVEHGHVAGAGAMAVRLGAFDAGIFQLCIEEAWAARPALGSAVQPELELVEGVAPSWSAAPEPGDADEVAAGPGVPVDENDGAAAQGQQLSAVASRLRLSLRDLVALLVDRGLSFAADVVDEGTEETLRALLGEGPADRPAPAANGARPESAVEVAIPDEDTGPAGDARSVAGRMLRKLLRDRRVGGRHTRIENAYGHHFSDGEKDLARRVAEWLEKDGILMPKLNEGSHHISINPRRLRDVGQIVEGTWERGADFDALA